MTRLELVSPVKWTWPGSLLLQSSSSHTDTPNTTLGRLWWLRYCWSRHRGGPVFFSWSSQHLATLQQYRSSRYQVQVFMLGSRGLQQTQELFTFVIGSHTFRLTQTLVGLHRQMCWQGVCKTTGSRHLNPRLQFPFKKQIVFYFF